MACEMVLCVDVGPAHQLKWCPLPSGSDVRKLHISRSQAQRMSVSSFQRVQRAATPRENLVFLPARSRMGPFQYSSSLSQPTWGTSTKDPSMVCTSLTWFDSRLVTVWTSKHTSTNRANRAGTHFMLDT